MEERARVAKDVNVIEQYFKDVQGMHDVLASGSVDGFDLDKYRADTILRRDTEHAKKQSEIDAEISTKREQIEDHHAAQVNQIQHEHKAMREGIDAKPGPKIGIGATFAAGPTGASVGVVNPAHVPVGSTRGRDAVVLEYNFPTRSDTVTDNLFEYKQQRAMEDLAAWKTTGNAGYGAAEQGHVPVLRDVEAASMPVGDIEHARIAPSAIVPAPRSTVVSEQLAQRGPDNNQFVDLNSGGYKQPGLKLPMLYATKENKAASEVSSNQEVFSKANNDMPTINQASADKPKPMLSNFERRFGGNDDYSRRAKNRQDIDKFFDSYVEEKPYSSEDAARDSVNEFMGSVESYEVKQSIFPRRQPISFINTYLDIHRDAEDSQTDYWDRLYNPEIKPAPVTINLPLLAGRFASIPVTAVKMLDMFVNSDNYIRTGEYAEYTIDARDVQRVENTFNFFADLPNTGIRPIWNAYISSYNSKMDESRSYALNGNDFMAGFTSGRAVGDVAMDAGGVLLFGYGAARAGHVFLKSVPRRVADLSVASALIGEPLTFEFQRASRAAGTEFMAVHRDSVARVYSQQKNMANLASEEGNFIVFNRNTIKSLKEFGVSESQIEILSKGEQIIFEDHSTKFPTATIFQFDGKILKAGIWDVIADKPGTLKSFAQRSINLAKEIGCDKIEIFGADIKNERLLNILIKRYGFYTGEPVIINEFGFKGVHVNTLRKNIDIKCTSEFSKLISKLSKGI